MIYCYKKGKPMPEREAMSIIRSAALRNSRLFPSRSFGVDDLMQQAIMGLLRSFPFKNGAIMYVAAHHQIIDYLRYVSGRKGKPAYKERGGEHYNSRDALEFEIAVSKEPSPEKLVDIKDSIEWAYKRLNARERLIVEAYANVGDGSVGILAKELGVTSPALFHTHNTIMERLTDENEDRVHRNDNRADSERIVRITENSEQVDRQRALKRLENTR